MGMTTVSEMKKNLTAEQQQLVNEIMKREDRQAKVDKLVKEVKETLSKN